MFRRREENNYESKEIERETIENLVLCDRLHMCGYRHPPRKNRAPQNIGKENKKELSKFTFLEKDSHELEAFKKILLFPFINLMYAINGMLPKIMNIIEAISIGILLK